MIALPIPALAARLEALAAGYKLAALAAIATLLLAIGWLPVLAVAALTALALCLFALGPMRLREGVPLGLVLAVAGLVVFTLAVEGTDRALVVLTRLSALVLFALLVTRTTRASAIQDAIVAGLRPFERLPFVSAEKVGLAIAVALRAIPRVGAAVAELREAREARGLKVGPVRLVVPLVVRILAEAREMAEAIDARSWSGASKDER